MPRRRERQYRIQPFFSDSEDGVIVDRLNTAWLGFVLEAVVCTDSIRRTVVIPNGMQRAPADWRARIIAEIDPPPPPLA